MSPTRHIPPPPPPLLSVHTWVYMGEQHREERWPSPKKRFPLTLSPSSPPPPIIRTCMGVCTSLRTDGRCPHHIFPPLSVYIHMLDTFLSIILRGTYHYSHPFSFFCAISFRIPSSQLHVSPVPTEMSGALRQLGRRGRNLCLWYTCTYIHTSDMVHGFGPPATVLKSRHSRNIMKTRVVVQ